MRISREGQKVGGGEVGGVGVEGWVEGWVGGGVAEGFGTLVRAEEGWGGEVWVFVLREEMVSLKEVILLDVIEVVGGHGNHGRMPFVVGLKVIDVRLEHFNLLLMLSLVGLELSL